MSMENPTIKDLQIMAEKNQKLAYSDIKYLFMSGLAYKIELVRYTGLGNKTYLKILTKEGTEVDLKVDMEEDL